MENEEEIQDIIDESSPPPPPPPSPQAITDAFHLPLITNALLTNRIMNPTPPFLINGLPTQFPYQFSPSFQIAQHLHQQQLLQQDRQLQAFWTNQLKEIKATNDFRNHSLPLARIKKIMKADEDVKMIAAETPVLFSKACEMFILELTHRAWSQAEHSKRRTLQKSDISSAIAKFPAFDFLVDIVPMEEEEGEKDAAGVSPVLEGEVLNEPIGNCFYDVSNYGNLMMDMRGPEMVSRRGFSFAQHCEEMECDSSMNSEEREGQL